MQIADFYKTQRFWAYSATWFGCTADLLLENSAILILYMNKLGATASLILFTSGISSLITMFLQIPSGSIVGYLGPKRGIFVSSGIVIAAFILISSGPFWGSGGKAVVVLGVALHAVSRALWNVSWYLILGNILRPHERGMFLGTMRFSYYLLNTVFFFALGIALTSISSIEFLQAIFLCVGMLSVGRILVISELKLNHWKKIGETSRTIKDAFRLSLVNSSLVGAAIYTAVISFAFAPVMQLALIYFKEGMKLDAGNVQLISSIGLGGNICAALFYDKILKRLGMKIFQISIHFSFILICAGLAFLNQEIGAGSWMCCVIFFYAAFSFTCFGCNVSREMLALARPGNEAMTTSFSLTYQLLGTGSGWFVSSFLLGCGCLKTSWKLYTEMTAYQTLFLVSGIFLCFLLIFLPLLPSVIPQHEDYYRP